MSESIPGSRAFGPGSRRIRAAAILVVVALGAAAIAGFAWPAGSPRATAGYGQLPSWLPKSKLAVGRIVAASSAHPSLAIEGDTVSVQLAHGRVLATAVGPAVPEEGRFPVPKTSPCSFTVTFAARAGDIRLGAGAFTILDEFGRLHRPIVTVSGGGALPLRLRNGQILSLTVTDVLPTGAGTLRWAPVGTTPIVSWDFDVEID